MISVKQAGREGEMRPLVKGKIFKESKLSGFWCSLCLARYLCFLVAALVLSVCIHKIRSQLLILALIMGVKWVSLDSYSGHKHIIILKGGEKYGVE